jgi:hypothetical protein
MISIVAVIETRSLLLPVLTSSPNTLCAGTVLDLRTGQ